MPADLFSLSSYHYELPEDLIAQYPCNPRDSSRLMIIERSSGSISEVTFRDLIDLMEPQDSLVFNDSKVFPSRLIGYRKSGGKAEVFLTKKRNDGSWEALVRPGRKLLLGATVEFGENFSCEIIEILEGGGRVVRFSYEGDFEQALNLYAQIPLPLYIRREVDPSIDLNAYQTVYAENVGSVAAPTAGLHFTEELLARLKEKGVIQTKATLHVGLGTFQPVKTDDIRDHLMHTEPFTITSDAADQLNSRVIGKKQICVGTTCCRMLESAAAQDGFIKQGQYSTNIFIYPGYQFKYVQSLLTNFHLPGSSLLMLVCAFAGYDLTMEAYSKAVKDKYRFFSYGDAMLII